MPKCHQVLLPHSAGLLSAVLPCFSYDDDNRQNILFCFRSVFFFFSLAFFNFLRTVHFLNSLSHIFERPPKKSIPFFDNWLKLVVAKVQRMPPFNGNASSLKVSSAVILGVVDRLPDLTITKMVEVLKTQIQMGAPPSRIIALTWVHHLFECLQDKVTWL